MMRVIAGQAKGRRLVSVRGQAVRPTQDRVRESLFNILAPRIEGAFFLDLFGGSGAVGIEALSRGAAGAVFVERDARACEVIRRNLIAVDLANNGRVLRQSGASALARLQGEGAEFDFIFLDPPYPEPELVADTLRILADRQSLLRPDGLIVAQMRAKERSPEEGTGWRLTDERRFGDTVLRFYRC